MRIYEASIAYNLVQLGDVQALTTPDKIAEYLRDGYAKNPCQESLWVVCLDRKNKPISRTMVTLGTLTCALAHPREVFKIAILASAAAIVVSHNHPSGDHHAEGITFKGFVDQISNKVMATAPMVENVVWELCQTRDFEVITPTGRAKKKPSFADDDRILPRRQFILPGLPIAG